MHICSKCGKELQNKNFSKDRRYKSGLSSYCNSCKYELTKIYNRTKQGLIKSIYNSQINSSKKRSNCNLCYTYKEFECWINRQENFDVLFNIWKGSNYNKNLRPSVDRKDDYKGYEFSNIQLMTWVENLEKYREDVKTGKTRKSSKCVVKISLETGVVLKEYYSIKQAHREGFNQSNIVKCCKGERKTHGGYIWKYKEEK